MKRVIDVVKKVVLSFVMLYGFNRIGVNFNIIIPINFITLTLVTFLGLPSLLSLVILYVVAF